MGHMNTVQKNRMDSFQQRCKLLVVAGENIKLPHGASDDEIEQIYEAGKEHYLSGRYDESIIHFTFLVMQCPSDKYFHLGLGLALYENKNYTQALTFLSYALFMDPTDPGPSYAMAQCLLALNEYEAARDALQTAIQQSHIDYNQYAAIYDLAKQKLDQL